MEKIKRYIKSFMSRKIWNFLHEFRHIIHLVKYSSSNYYAELRVRKKTGKLKVLFIALWDNNWKYDSLFKLMQNNPNFDPIILVCPIVSHGRDYMLAMLKQCSEFFKRKGYPYILSYDDDSDTYFDALSIEPDLVFFTNPYPGVIDEHYRRDKFKNSLTCYSNYFYVALKDTWGFAEDFHKSLWRYYVENQILYKQIRLNNTFFSQNCRVTGYPLFDNFRLYQISDKDWPLKESHKKRIIWAPHHTIKGHTEGYYALSTFEMYYEFMLGIAKKYENELEIVFKPHPLLRAHLYESEDWGKIKTDSYYEMWANGKNTAYVDGEYIGLFLASDGMIHDCNSFTIEYLAVNKPVMFLDSGKTGDKFNEVVDEARLCHYNGTSNADIDNFIKDVILGSNDSLNFKREQFRNKYIFPVAGKSIAENIVDDLLTSLGRK